MAFCVGFAHVVPVFFAFVEDEHVDACAFEFVPSDAVGVFGFVVFDESAFEGVCVGCCFDVEDCAVAVEDGFVDVWGLCVLVVLVVDA